MSPVDEHTKRRESRWASIADFSPVTTGRTLIALFAALGGFWALGALTGWLLDDVAAGQTYGLVLGFVMWLSLVGVAMSQSNARGWRYRGSRRRP